MSNSTTLIDHKYSNRFHPNHESGIIITDIADNFAIFHIIYGTPRPQKTVYRQVRQLNPRHIASFSNQLHKADSSTVYSVADVSEAHDNFMIIYKSLFALSSPDKNVKIKKQYIKSIFKKR